MNQENGRQFLSALYREVWCALDRNKIDKFYAKTLSGFIDQQPITYSDILNSIEFCKKHIDSLDYAVHDAVSENNKVAGVINLKGKNKDGEGWYSSLGIFVELMAGKINKLRIFSSVMPTLENQTAQVPQRTHFNPKTNSNPKTIDQSEQKQ